MLAKTYSAIPLGYNGHLIEVEGDANRGLPAFNIVGMPNKTISEAKERVRSAIINSGFTFPSKKLTINLAPAEIQKDGTHLDLPIAITILLLSKQLLPSDIKHCFFVGELSLDGSLRPVRGIINILESAHKSGFKSAFIPKANLPEAQLIKHLQLFPAENLQQIFLHLKHQKPLPENQITTPKILTSNSPLLDQIKGQTLAKRALIIALAGYHNLLLYGPPGSGKTFLSRTAISLLPSPNPEEQIAIAKIHNLSTASNLNISRPFRTPHHTSSPASIIGGGRNSLPGEISLAHHGILFLDELPEYPRNVLEALRQPLEDHQISISRANQKITYPANFILIATMNPCPCGYFGSNFQACTCSDHQIATYRKKLSGPLLDRIDLIVSVPKVKTSDLSKLPNSDQEHQTAKQQILSATKLQLQRYHNPTLYNGRLNPADITKYIKLSPSVQTLLNQASNKLQLSARSYFKIIKITRTIADLENSPEILPTHLAEALNLRTKLP